MRFTLTSSIFAGALIISAVQTGLELKQYLTMRSYDALAAKVRGGRAEFSDLVVLGPVLNQHKATPCGILRNSQIVMLHFYANDLIAQQAGEDPFLPTNDPVNLLQRNITHELLGQALACAPMDGNLWLHRATLSHAIGFSTEYTTRYLERSLRYAPFENRIAVRREQIFCDRVNELPFATACH